MNVILAVDKFSKYSHFLPLSHPFTAITVAKLFFSEIYRLHGMLVTIVSDRDRIFTNQLWKELFHLSGVTLAMSSAYHPQTDGPTERDNQCLETFLRCFVHACPSQWVQWLSLAEYWYNTSYHSSLGRSPFKVLYGRSP
jgi:transposase InsO family protein